MKLSFPIWAISILLALLSIYPSHAAHLSDQLMVSSKLTGDQEVPAVNTSAVGVATFNLNSTWDTMCVNISVNGLSGPITGIHVHEASSGQNGPVVTNLSPFVSGNRVVAMLTGADLTSAMIANYLSGNYYLNVHTAANPGGEIRGQLMLETDWGFRANLDTTQQTHAVTNDAWGVGYFNLSHDKSSMQVRVVADGLSGSITAAHFHYGAAGMNGGVAVNLSTLINGNTISGTIDATMPGDFIDSLLAGSIYLNVHTTANPAGELRGQVWLDKRLAFDAWANAAQQVTPPTGAMGMGAAYLSLNTTLDTLWYEIQAESLTGAITGAHLHDGETGVAGGVLVNFTTNINGNRISGMATGADITPSLVSKMLSGGTYINIHTTANPGGEIRGQVFRLAREGYSFALDAGQEVPSEFAIAQGSGMLSINRDQTDVHFMMTVSNLTGPLTGVHFHKALAGKNGGVIFNLTSFFDGMATDDAAFGYWKSTDMNAFTTLNAAQIRNDSVYVNMHTMERPAGEVRGQVRRGAVCFTHPNIDYGDTPANPMFTNNLLFSARLGGDQEVPAVVTDALGVGGFLLNAGRDSIWVNINVDGLSGPITGIHIHEAAKGATGPVVFDLSGMATQNQISGVLTGFDLNKFITGAYYVNVHTDANPNGEIRGQISFESASTYTADINGAQSVPAVNSTAFGRGVFNLSKDEGMLEIRVVTSGLSGPITGAHLHMGALGTSGGVVENLTANIKDNSILAMVDPTSYLADLKAGNIYINVHTDANPGGEIRGQLMLAHTFTFDAWMNGSQEVPFSNVPGQGVAIFWFNETWDTLSYDIVVDQLSGSITGAHIHNGISGTNGGVEVNLSTNINGNRISGTIAGMDLTSAFIDNMIMGTSYINVHTAAFPGGEIRGQVYRLARDGYTFDMCGDQEVPSVGVDGYGGGILSIDRNHSTAHLMFTTTALTDTITGAHLHDAARGMSGGVLYNVTGSLVQHSGFSYVSIDSMGASMIKSGNVYLNVHTDSNPGGEVRGQIDNGMDCPAITIGIDNVLEEGLIGVFPNPFSDRLYISHDLGQLQEMTITIVDLMGKVIYSEKINYPSQTEKIEVQNLPSGNYMLMISVPNGKTVQKIVKM